MDLVAGAASSFWQGRSLAGAALTLLSSGALLAGTPNPGPTVNAMDFGADPTGTVDSAPALQRAIDAAQGRTVFVPPGLYVVTQPLVYSPAQAEPLGPGLILRGAGRHSTVFDNRVANGSMLVIRSPQPLRFQGGGELSDFGIVTTTRPPASNGIYLKGVWQTYLRNVLVRGLTGDGVRVESILGDADAPVNVSFESGFFWDNDGYGMRFTNAPGVSNISFVSIRDSSIQGNLAGGVFWNGQQLHLSNTGIAANRGAGGLLIGYNDANAQLVNAIGCTFENNEPRHLDIETLLNGYFAGNQFTSSTDVYPSDNAIRLGGKGGGLLRNLTFVNNTAQIGPAFTPHTFFEIAPSATRTVIGQMRWQLYDAPGQERYRDHGLESRLTDAVLFNLQAPAPLAAAAGPNQDVDIGQEYGLLRVAAPGAFSIGGFRHGGNGRVLTLLNASGHPLALTHEDPGSQPANRVWLAGGAPVTVPHLGTASLVYDHANRRWWLVGTH